VLPSAPLVSESTLEAPAIAHPASPPAEPTEAPKAWTLRGFMRAHPWWSIAVALVIVSVALVAYARTRPSYDAYGWIVWAIRRFT
jgi:hypothetical protein